MDVDDEITISKKCFKLDQTVFDNLNIIYNSLNFMIILWNKYHVLIYENSDLQTPVKIVVPEFQLDRLIASGNYLVCLDNSGKVHLTSLKFKTTGQSLKIAYQPRDEGVKTCIGFQDYILSLKCEADTFFLNLHRVNSDFQLVKCVILLSQTEHCPDKQNTKHEYVLVNHTVDNAYIDSVKDLLKVSVNKNVLYDLLVLSYDNYTVYGCLFSPQMPEEESTLVKLYSCPAEICTLEIIHSGELYLIIALKMGTVIRLCLNDASKPPNTVHLNTSIFKALALKDNIIYTDGETMWKSENTFSEGAQFTQFFLKDAHDFVKWGDQIICTTFSKLLYIFSLEDKNSYIIPKSTEEYCAADKLLNNSEYLDKLFNEIENNDELVKKITSEQTYISALALANREAVVKKAIDSNVLVFENYENVDKTDIVITEELKEYFEVETWNILVSVSNLGIFDILNGLLTNLSKSLRIHTTVFSNDKVLKTTTLKLNEPLKKVQFLIPIRLNNFGTVIKVNIKVVVKIPGALDGKPTWTVLYRNDVILNCEHFIKIMNRKTILSLKNPTESIEELITKINFARHGNTFQFDDIKTLQAENEWSFYIKLPDDYNQLLINENYCKKHFNDTKCAMLHEKFANKEFLDAKNSIILQIGNEKFRIMIQNDGFSSPLLVVTGRNISMVFDLRMFFSNLLYNDYESKDVGIEYINSTFYTTTENLQKAVKNCIINSTSFEDFAPVMDKFEKHIVGNLPL